jgi:wobble nucleotide-excising tRNase
MNRYSVLKVLSEGEQKAISLSEFLAELKLEKSVAPVVFDDPVNSLDHLLIDKFAKRILQLSEERQVIVFTHSILLFNSLAYQITNSYKHLDFQKYNVSKQYGIPGYLSNAEEPLNSPKEYIKGINIILNVPDKSRTEDSVAAEGYGLLRAAIEVFVEREMLQSVVKRYQKNIALSLLTKIDGATIDSNKQELNDVFSRCCGYISGHSNPEIVVQSATIDELQTDFDRFKEIRKRFV